MIVHCLFEQSGTFKNAFKKYGIEAYDYDIQNEFNETDYVTDLFKVFFDTSAYVRSKGKEFDGFRVNINDLVK